MEIIDLSASSETVTFGRQKVEAMGSIVNAKATLDSALSRLDRIMEAEYHTSNKKGKSKSKANKGSGTGYGGSAGAASLATQKATEKARHSEQANDGVIRLALNDLSEVLSTGVLTDTDAESRKLLEKLKLSKGLCITVVTLLRNESLIDIGHRIELYRALLGFLMNISREPYTVPYLTVKIEEDSDETCFSLIAALSNLASTFVSLQVASMEESGGDMVENSLAIALSITEVHAALERGSVFAKNSGIESSANAGALKKAAVAHGPSSPPSSSTTTGTSSSIPSWLDREQKRYTQFMKRHRFAAIDLCDMVSAGEVSHIFIGGGRSTGAQAHQLLKQSAGHAGVSGDPRKRMVRVASEMAGLSASLPVEHGSSVFVRCDESRMDILKALIIGPEGTPYANGCFEFDIQLPPDYPNQPPRVQLVTTGSGSVRFNPNLYNCGKVCLSLLGTWQGPGWDPTSSTLLQVLVSIQSLILVPDPYFNEPGYERSQGTPSGEAQSRAYNTAIRRDTLRVAILDQLRKPPPVFQDVITDHYKLKKTTILQQLNEWSADTPSAQPYISALRPLVEQLGDVVEPEKKEAAPEEEYKEHKGAGVSSSSSSSSAAVGAELQGAATSSTDSSKKRPAAGASAGAAFDIDADDFVIIDDRGKNTGSATYWSSPPAQKKTKTGGTTPYDSASKTGGTTSLDCIVID